LAYIGLQHYDPVYYDANEDTKSKWLARIRDYYRV